MAISQISVFTESKPGHLAKVLEIFEDAGVNVRGFAVSDTGEYGITRFVVDDPAKASKALSEAGRAFVSADVVAIKLEDEPGELARVMIELAKANVNVEYSYSLISTYIVISTDDDAKAIATLDSVGIKEAALADIAECA